MQITALMVKDLRERTGAPMMDCKGALQESDGDVDKAIDILRTKGLSAAAKKAGRATLEGMVGQYVHAGGKLGVLVEVNCETDFVACTEDFQKLVKDIAMHIAAADPQFVSRDEVSADVLEKEREIFRQQALETGKPENVIDRIIAGKVEKFYSQAVLLEQPFVKDTDTTVGDMIGEVVGRIRENIQVRRFARYKLGDD